MLRNILNSYRRLTPLETAERELADAHFRKLEAESAVDYAKSVVAYNDARIDRLNKRIAAYSEVKE
jgi:hypothetical protein